MTSEPHTNLPPKAMTQQVRSLAALRQETQEVWPVREGEGGPMASGARRLPVLQAFHEFLEIERRRARLRMWVLSGVFTLVLLCVVGVGLLAGAYLLRRTDSDVASVRADLDRERKETEAFRSRADGRMAALASEALALRNGVAEAQSALVSVRDGISGSLEGRKEELKDLMDVLELLQTQNAELKGRVDMLRSRETAAAAEPVERAPPMEGPEKVAAPLPEELQLLEPSDRVVKLGVTPPGKDHPVTLRVPIPE